MWGNKDWFLQRKNSENDGSYQVDGVVGGVKRISGGIFPAEKWLQTMLGCGKFKSLKLTPEIPQSFKRMDKLIIIKAINFLYKYTISITNTIIINI